MNEIANRLTTNVFTIYNDLKGHLTVTPQLNFEVKRN